jgi:EpsD family peptidyl-prolyl cis-trans isomerase
MKTSTTIIAALVSALAVSACGESASEKKVATQAAAKVNDGEISVHQINFVLQRGPSIQAEQADAARRQVLEGLIDQELAVQQALEAKLDRTPNVMQLLEATRREVLARAYLEQAGSGVAKPTATELRTYYADHPDNFANRKVYRLEELAFMSTPETLAKVKDQLAKGQPVAAIADSLKASGVAVSGGPAIKSAEQISLDLLPRIARAKEGQPQIYEDAGRAAIVTVLGTKPEPLDEAKALPLIESYLTNKQKAERVSDAVKQLRGKAKIEYSATSRAVRPQHPPKKSRRPPATQRSTKALPDSSKQSER